MDILNTEEIESENKILHELYFESLASKAKEVSSIIKNCGLCLKVEFKEKMGIEDNDSYNMNFHATIASMFIFNLIVNIFDGDRSNISIYIAGIQKILFDMFWDRPEPKKGINQEEFKAADLKMKNVYIDRAIKDLIDFKNRINGIQE